MGADAARIALRVDVGLSGDGNKAVRRAGMHTVQMHNASVQYCGQATHGQYRWLKRFCDARPLNGHKGWDIYAEMESQTEPLRAMGAEDWCLDAWRMDEAAISTVERHFHAVDRLQ